MNNADLDQEQTMAGGWLGVPELARGRLSRFVLFVLVAFAIAEVGARVLERSQETPPLRWYDEAAQIRVEMMGDRTADLVFAGTSMAQQAFVPSVFDEGGDTQSFNVGLPGAVPTLAGPWLTDVVLDRLEPTTVVWGLSSLDLSSSYGEAPTAAWRGAPATRTDLLGRVDNSLAQYSGFIRMRSLLRRPDDLWGHGAARRRLAFEREQLITGPDGERLGFDAQRTGQGENINRGRLQQFTIDADDLDAVSRSVAALQAAGVRVVFVELPVPPAFIALHPSGTSDHELVSGVIEDLAADLGVDHLGLEGSWDDDDFADFTHLTAAAAADFTRSVAQRLQQATPGNLVPQGNGALEEAAAARSAADALTNTPCEPEVVVDEYGFEIEITSCVGGDDAVAALGFPNGDVEAAFDLAVSRARSSATICANAEAWRTSMTSTLRALDELATAVEQIDAGNAWIGSAESALLLHEASLEVLGQPGCAGLPHAAEPETVALFSRAVSTLNRLSISAAGNNASGGPLWFRTDQAGHIDALRELVSTGERVDLLTIGSSTVKRGFDTEEITGQTGTSAFNVGVAALSAEVAGPWMNDLFELGLQPSTVVVGFTGLEYMTPCSEGRRDDMQRSLAIRAAMERLGVDAIGLEVTADDPLVATYITQFQTRGTTDSSDGTDSERVEQGQERYRQVLQDDICDQRITAFADLLEAIRRTLPASRIVVVDMPLHPEMVLVHPSSPDGFDEGSARAQDIANSVDAEYLDAQQFLSADEFGDFLHANAPGRARLTELLLDHLGES